MISKYLLLTLAILMMPLAVRACVNDEGAQKTEQRELTDKLAHSEYVVEKGKLARRHGAAEAAASTPLGRDEELRTMEKALDAAKPKLNIPDGSGVIVVDGKDYYEVIIGVPPTAETPAQDYAAKVLVDKKTLAVVEVKETKNVDDEAALKVEQFKELSDRLTHGEYVVEKGKLARRPQGKAGPKTSLSRDDEFRVMEKALDAAKSKLNIPEGSGVIISEVGGRFEVIIGTPPPAGTLGPDYKAKVLVDKKTLEVVEVLAGG